MKKELAEKLIELAEEMGYGNEYLELKEDYSGRGMFGEKTYAIVGLSIQEALMVAIGCADAFVEDDDPIFENLEPIHQDSMGLSTVIY